MNEFAPKDSSGNDPEQQAANQLPDASYAEQTAAKENTALKWLKKGAFFVVVIAAVFGWKHYNKLSASTDVKKQMYEVYANFPDQAHIRKVIDKLHDRCFDECYKAGGRRTSAKFDTDRYVQMMDNAIERELATSGWVPEGTAQVKETVVEETAPEESATTRVGY